MGIKISLTRYRIFILCALFPIGLQAQIGLKPLNVVKLNKKGIPHGQYSGITKINDSIFAVVHDKADRIFFIRSNDLKHFQFTSVDCHIRQRDPEGITYLAKEGTFFISGESDQKIMEYGSNGMPTGRELHIPEMYNVTRRRTNAGFEALSYNAVTHKFWTTTEQGLREDSINTIRLQSFDDESLNPEAQYLYRIDLQRKPNADNTPLAKYAYGVPDILALDDGSLIIMERELFVPKKAIGGWCDIRLYHYCPESGEKRLLDSFTTHLQLTRINLANYEGIAFGPTLPDGTRTIILINDSQDGAGNTFAKLHDYLKIYAINYQP